MAKLRLCVLALIALVAAPVLAQASVVYTNNFDAAATCGDTSCLLSGGSNAVTVAAANGFSGNQRSAGNAVSGPISVTFTGLPSHDALSVDFLVALLASWDGHNCCTDIFTVRVDGVDVLRTIVGAGGGGTTDYYADNTNQGVPGAVLLQGPGINPTELNLGNDSRLDNIAHTASTLTVQFLCTNGVPGAAKATTTSPSKTSRFRSRRRGPRARARDAPAHGRRHCQAGGMAPSPPAIVFRDDVRRPLFLSIIFTAFTPIAGKVSEFFTPPPDGNVNSLNSFVSSNWHISCIEVRPYARVRRGNR